MDIRVERYEPDAFLDAIDRLHARGARRFLLRGATEVARRVLETAHDGSRFAGATFTLADRDGERRRRAPGSIDVAEAMSIDFDALLLFASGRDREILAELSAAGKPLVDFVYHAPPVPAVTVSLPKSGTHLLMLLFSLMGASRTELETEFPDGAPFSGGADGAVRVVHSVASVPPAKVLAALDAGYVSLALNFRDPRAQAYSYTNFYHHPKFAPGHEHNAFGRKQRAIYQALKTPGERLRHFLKEDYRTFVRYFETHYYLLRDPSVLAIRYEELVGSRGGGDDRTRRATTLKLMRHLRIGGCPDEVVAGIDSRETETFHRGVVDAWREAFTPEIDAAFREKFDGVLELYGYEW